MTFVLRPKSIFLFGFMVLCLVLGACHPAEAKTKRHKPASHKHHAPLLVDGTAAYADIVMDAETGQILHATNPDRLRHPASLTKMMTLYVTFQALEAGRLGLNQYLPISSNAAEQPPSKLGLRPGARIRVEDAILGLVTESANDAAVVLAEWMGNGSTQTFAGMMTRQAQALGMKNSNFDNPNGLPDDLQVTTARDMAILGHALIYHFAQYYPYFSHDSFTYQGVAHHNHNHLMDRYDGMDGIKTGYIRASGFNLVASAKRGNIRLIGVVFGGHSTVARDNRMAQLLDDGFALERQERASGRIAVPPTDGSQGDGGSGDESDTYVTLPAKMASLSPSRAALPEPTHPNPAQGDPMGGENNWGIQIGAYSDANLAQQALSAVAANMPQTLGTAAADVQTVQAIGGGVLYRARLIAIDQQTAQNACAWMVQHGQTCLTVGPQQ